MNKENKKIPQAVFNAMRSAEEAQARITETMKSMAPTLLAFNNLKISKKSLLDSMEIKLGPPTEVIREQNNWERHAEMLNVHNALLQAQQEMLKDQKSAKKFVIIGLVLSGIAALFAVIAVIPVPI